MVANDERSVPGEGMKAGKVSVNRLHRGERYISALHRTRNERAFYSSPATPDAAQPRSEEVASEAERGERLAEFDAAMPATLTVTISAVNERLCRFRVTPRPTARDTNLFGDGVEIRRRRKWGPGGWAQSRIKSRD